MLLILVPDFLGDPGNYTASQARGALSICTTALLSLPSKPAAVWALILPVSVPALFPVLPASKEQSITFQPLGQSLFLSTSSKPLNTNMNLRTTHRHPFITVRQLASILYFFLILVLMPTTNITEK